jgi:hypothetical protein
VSAAGDLEHDVEFDFAGYHLRGFDILDTLAQSMGVIMLAGEVDNERNESRRVEQ